MPKRLIAVFTLSVSRSNGYSGVCTPMTARPWSLYFWFQVFTYGSVLMQLMHV